MTEQLSPQMRNAYNLLFDCYNQWAYENPKGLWNGGLSTLEDLELMLGIESPIKREELWKLRDNFLNSITDEPSLTEQLHPTYKDGWRPTEQLSPKMSKKIIGDFIEALADVPIITLNKFGIINILEKVLQED